MTKIKNLGIAVAVLLLCAGCASKKVAVQQGAEIVRNDIQTDETKETKTVETIKTEKIIEGDTIRKTIPSSTIKGPSGVVIENDAQRITINYNTKSDSFIIEGVQKAKKELQEIRREINEKSNKATTDKSKSEKDHRTETPLPADKKGWSGVEWGFFWLCAAVVTWFIWKFRSGIWGFVKGILGK